MCSILKEQLRILGSPASLEQCRAKPTGAGGSCAVKIKPPEDLEKACLKAFGKAPLVVFELGGVVSANTGPDTVALVYTGHPRG